VPGGHDGRVVVVTGAPDPSGPRVLEPVRRTKTGAAVANSIRSKIVSGELLPGDRLPPEDQLVGQLGVARNTLREGMRILENEGVVSVRGGRYGGAYVTKPFLESLAASFVLHLQLADGTFGDLAEARIVLEPRLAGMLAARRNTDDLETLARCIRTAEEAAADNDPARYGHAVASLHEAILVRAGNLTLAVIGRLLHQLLEDHYRTVLRSWPDEERLQLGLEAYWVLYRHVEAGDAEGAEQHWRLQMRDFAQRMGAVQSTRLRDVPE
jgi:GntR family transcriptional repressor for pyruvate dehydrogenase complex